jgi:cobalt-zinc-cadmium efflux system outer membrane protein
MNGIQKILIYIFVFGCCIENTFAQQQSAILSLTIAQADSLLVANNLEALAKRYDVSAAQALMVQAKLRPNPNINVGAPLISPERKRVLDIGTGGDRSLNLQQLIQLADKRKKRTALATESAKVPALELLELMRSLRYTLRTNLYDLHFQNNTLNLLNNQINTVQNIINTYKPQVAKGNIPLRDLVRLQSLVFSLQNDRTELLTSISDIQKQLRILLAVPQSVETHITDEELGKYSMTLDLPMLTVMAMQARPDLQVISAAQHVANLHYTYQKAMATPDLLIGAQYQYTGGYSKNYIGVSLGMDLPVFNKNQGNIENARLLLEKEVANQHTLQNMILGEVSGAYEKLQHTDTAYKNLDKSFLEQSEILHKSMLTSYEKQHITLLEFIDFFETYTENLRQYNRLQANRIAAFEELNYVVGL